MVSVFDTIPNNFFNLLSSNSNYRTNAALLQFIYEQYDNEISYRIKRNVLRDELAYYISDNSEELRADNDTTAKSYQDMASAYLGKFASKDVGWLEEEFDESTFEKYIIITEQGVMLAELLIRLERPEREELSSYMYNIYNTLMNQEQWNGDPYVGALKNVYKNAKALSKSLKKMSTYIRKTIEKLMKEISYESLTDNIITYCDGDFIKEYARLTKPQNNIHIYRGKIITMLEQMQNDDDIYELITIGCVNEEDIEEWEAEEKIDLMFDTIKKFLKDDYLRSNTKKWFVFKETRIDDCKFYTVKDKEVTVYPRHELTVKGKKVLAGEFMNRDKGTEQVLRALGLRCGVEKYKAKLVKMMAFNPENNIDKFIQECILDEHPMV